VSTNPEFSYIVFRVFCVFRKTTNWFSQNGGNAPYGATCYKPARQPPLKKESFGVVIVKEEGSEGKKNFHSSAAGGCHFLNLGFYCVFYCFSFLNSNFLATLGSFWQPCQFFLYIYISIYLSIYLYFLALVAKVAIRFSLFLKNL